MITDLIQPIELKSRVYLNKIAEVSLNNEADKDNAVLLLKEIVEYKKAINTQKKELAAPLKAKVKTIEERFKNPLEFLEQADNTLRTKINAYLDLQAKKAQEEAIAKRQLMEDKALEQAEKLEALKNSAGEYDKVTAQALVETINEQQNKIINDTAKAQNINLSNANSTVRMVWDFEVVDLSKVPLQYLCLNEKAVREAIKNGIHDIDGLNIFKRAQVAIK